MNLTEADTPLCNALESNALDSFDLRAWKSLAKRLERDLAQIRAQGQEPVAWMFSDEEGNDDFGNNLVALKDEHYRGGPIVPLYAAPPVAQEPSHYLYGFPEYNGAIRWSLSDENQNGSAFVIRKPVFDAPPVPQGMVLVPIEPTEEMLTALRKAYNTARDCFYDGIEGVAANPPLQAYNAMLSVAQGGKP